MAKLNSRVIQQAAKVLRVIGHPDRLRIVEALEHQSKNVADLAVELRLQQAALSKHLAVLRREGIVKSRVTRNFRYYSIAYPNVIHVLNCVRGHGGQKK